MFFVSLHCSMNISGSALSTSLVLTTFSVINALTWNTHEDLWTAGWNDNYSINYNLNTCINLLCSLKPVCIYSLCSVRKWAAWSGLVTVKSHEKNTVMAKLHSCPSSLEVLQSLKFELWQSVCKNASKTNAFNGEDDLQWEVLALLTHRLFVFLFCSKLLNFSFKMSNESKKPF